MIRLSRLNGKEFILNSDLIKFIESTPDTIVTLTTGEKLMVRESPDQVVQQALQYRQKIQGGPIGPPPESKTWT